jgi:Protein of unknown function (DUF2844)
MFSPRFPSLRWMVASAFLAALPLPAMASLGGNTNSVEADRAQMNARAQVTSHDAYTVHAISAPSGIVVNEFIAPDGKVFAVAWHGHFMPQLQQILGTYFQEYTKALAAQEQHYGRRPMNLQTEDLVVQMSGHMGHYDGRAYLPGALPPGVNLGEIQ